MRSTPAAALPVDSTRAAATIRVLAAAGAAAALATLLVAGRAEAQMPARAGAGLHIAPYAGYLVQTGELASGPFDTRVQGGNGMLLGAQLGLDLTPTLAIVGNVGYMSSDLRVGVPILGGFDVGSNRMWLYDGALQLSVPLEGSAIGIRPFIQAGAGAITQELDVSALGTRATSFAWNLGGGVDLQLTRNVAVRLLAKDYISRFDTEEATGFDVDRPWSHTIGLSAGLKLGF